MRLLITGAGGFLGKHVMQALAGYSDTLPESIDAVITPNSKSCDLTSQSSVLNLFERERPDVVLHLAASCGGIGFNKNYPADVLQTNLSMAVNLFEAASKYKPEYIYTCGSVCSYPKYCPTPFKEDDLWNGFPEETNAGYGFSKLALLMLQQEYRKQYGIKGAHFVIVNLYGPHDDFDLQNSHVVPALINKFVTAVDENKDTVECWGTGQATREFFYAQDCADALIKATVNKFDYDSPINLGTGEDISIYDLAHLIAKLTGFKGKIVFTGEVSDGQPERKLDVSRANDVLGWSSKTNLLTGLANTIDWYQNSRDTIPTKG